MNSNPKSFFCFSAFFRGLRQSELLLSPLVSALIVSTHLTVFFVGLFVSQPPQPLISGSCFSLQEISFSLRSYMFHHTRFLMGQVGIGLCRFPSHFRILFIFSRLIFWTSFQFTNLMLLGVAFYLLIGCFFHVLCSFGFNLDFSLCCLFVVALFLGCFMLLLFFGFFESFWVNFSWLPIKTSHLHCQRVLHW